MRFTLLQYYHYCLLTDSAESWCQVYEFLFSLLGFSFEQQRSPVRISRTEIPLGSKYRSSSILYVFLKKEYNRIAFFSKQSCTTGHK